MYFFFARTASFSLQVQQQPHTTKFVTGISSVMSDSSRGTRYSDRLVFEGAVARSSHYDDGIIIFPDNNLIFNVLNNSKNNVDDNEIDLSGSFQLTQTTTSTTTTISPPHNLHYNLTAYCNSVAHLRLLIDLNANATSGTYTYPNGTQVTFARCEVILIKHPD